MKSLIAIAAIAALSLNAFAEGKEVTLTGEGKCLKCALHKAEKCQNVLEVKDGDKTTLYHLTGEASDKAHKSLGLCGDTKKVTVHGSCVKKDDHFVVTVAKIEEAK
jgi:hypothetical protein